MINDTFGLPEMALFREMSPQEQQQMQQQMMAPEMMKQQLQQARLDSQSQQKDSGNETKLLDTLLKQVITPDAAHAMLNDLTGSDALPMSNDQPAGESE